MDFLKNKLIKKPIIIICATTFLICSAIVVCFNISERKRNTNDDGITFMVETIEDTTNSVDSDEVGEDNYNAEYVDSSASGLPADGSKTSGLTSDGATANSSSVNSSSTNDKDMAGEENLAGESDSGIDNRAVANKFQDMQEDMVLQTGGTSDIKTKQDVSEWKKETYSKSGSDELSYSSSVSEIESVEQSDIINSSNLNNSGVNNGVTAHTHESSAENDTSASDSSTVIEEMQSDGSSTDSNTGNTSEGKKYETIRIPAR